MTIFVKNKHTLQIDEFKFRCYQDKCKALKKLGESCNEENGSDFICENSECGYGADDGNYV
jgi:hypothetical protein